MAAPNVDQTMSPPPADPMAAAVGPMPTTTLGIDVKEDTELVRQEVSQWLLQGKEMVNQAPLYAETVKMSARQKAQHLMTFVSRPAPVFSTDPQKVVNVQRVFFTSALILAVATISRLIGRYVAGPVLLNWAVDGPTKALLLLAGLPVLYRYTPDRLVPKGPCPRPPLFMVEFAAGVGIITGSMLSTRFTGYISTGGTFFPLITAALAVQFDKKLTGQSFLMVLAATVGAGSLVQLTADTVLNKGVPLPLLLLVPLQAGLEGLALVRFLMDAEEDVAGKNCAMIDLRAKLFQLFIWAFVQAIGGFLLGSSYPMAPPV